MSVLRFVFAHYVFFEYISMAASIAGYNPCREIGGAMKYSKFLTPGYLFMAYGLVVAGYLLAASWSQPILDSHHGFRQTQTAISAYWLAREGSTFAYQTPVLGYPWSIPFEFPLYQWLIAKIAGSAPVAVIDHVGRVLNLLFFLGSAVLVYLIAMLGGRDKKLALICASTLLISPLMLFWSRGVMIESTAVFFSLAFVWALAKYVERPRLIWPLIALAAACIAALVKITTFFGFAIFACGALIIYFAQDTQFVRLKQNMKLAVVSGLIVAASLIVLKLWLLQADELKSQTIWGTHITSPYLNAFNFGTTAQRMDPAFWTGVVFGRSLQDGLGSPWVMLAATIVVLADRRSYQAGLLLMVAYLAPFLVFTNLHLVHDYYQYANVVFATSLLGLAVWVVMEKSSRFGQYFAPVLALALCIISWSWVSEHYLPLIREDMAAGREMQLAKFIDGHTGEGSTLLIFGMDWASTLPYYSSRKALMMPDWLPAEEFKLVLDSGRAFGDAKFGALIVCPNQSEKDPAKVDIYRALISRYSHGLSKTIVSGCDLYS
ncbi:phospholipid carrier-dependent glycosyltransferase [Dyella tabacisoli]|uniref:Phospholipid carrier-dependent glycosyltransferase n=1 Tax=Dyella tabacisoli TaxID=2282381 RepID=A0A369UIK9_9GAMM|nr:phospholipid carrier-dependent glycosyltransferase [Dyella tabacisoli]RDD80582.1 phospholipid carrier-dependent glycosyltransferase [Dyella tabacisoli]